MKTKQAFVYGVFAVILALTFTACSNGSTGGGPGKPGGPTISIDGDGTPGLAYELINNGTAYRVRKGTVTTGKVVIPAYYSETARRGNMYRALDDGSLPVKEIGSADDEKENGAFAYTNITEIEIPGTVELIGNGAFYETNLVSIEIPEGVTVLLGNSFSGLSSLSSLTIPASVEYISGNELAGCHNLTSIIVAEGNPNYSSEGGILYDISGDYGRMIHWNVLYDKYDYGNKVLHSWPSASGSVTIPAGVTSIGMNAFLITSITSIVIPASVTFIGPEPFWACRSLSSITVAPGNPNYSSESGILYNKAKTEILIVPEGISGSVVIPSSVTTIGGGAFADCTSLTSVTIPESVTSIGNGPFIGCTSLTNITVAAGNPNYLSEGGILYNKNKTELIQAPGAISNVVIPASVTTIGGRAFSEGIWGRSSRNLTSVAFASGSQLQTIGEYAFENCTSLTSITIPSSVTTIDERAFYNCTGLTSITIPSSVTYIGSFAFSSWTSSQTIYVEGHASQAAADAEWTVDWRNGCNAVIKYKQSDGTYK